MVGKVFITRSGYDPQVGRHVKDPYLGDGASLGACRPDVRRAVAAGDYIFAISGKVQEIPQFVMGGFVVDSKIPAAVAYKRFPEQRLHRLPDGQVAGNIIVNSRGGQHALDTHEEETFGRRIQDYVVGGHRVALETSTEIARGREESLQFLCDLLEKTGDRPFDLLGRSAKTLTERQVERMWEWLRSLKDPPKTDD